MTPPASRPDVSPDGSYLVTDEASLTPIVLAAFGRIEDPRLREITLSLISHLHACVRETRLSKREWEQAVDFLKQLAQATTGRYNGPMALSDMLGISTLVCLVNDKASDAGDLRTAGNVLGPLWRADEPEVPNGGTIVRSETPGEPLFAACRVLDLQGQPVPDVEVHVWQASPEGLYENQDPQQAEMNLRARLRTDAEGRFAFRSVLPAGYPASKTEPLASLIRVAKRNPWRPAHVHFMFHKPGYETLTTQVFTPYCPHLRRDVVFGATQALVGNFRRHETDAPAEDVVGTWYSLEQTFVLAPGEARLPVPPIQ
ncbi:MAG TPA: dioxygenase [Ramlibacter sp.]|nr:dioxygenase [Ramlibacter sp.]